MTAIELIELIKNNGATDNQMIINTLQDGLALKSLGVYNQSIVEEAFDVIKKETIMEFDREVIIASLIDKVASSDDYGQLAEMLANGFKGYDNMTNEELVKECKKQGISSTGYGYGYE